MKSSLIPVDERDFGVVMHPRRQYFQNIQDKLKDPQPPPGQLMAFEDLDIMEYENSTLMEYEI